MIGRRPKRSGARVSKQSSGVRRGRFKKGMDDLFSRFNASISFDRRLFAEDIAGSIAHVRMLGRQKIISRQDALTIEKGLKSVREDIEKGRMQFREDLEDVHINIEEALRDRIGAVADKLHTARSRNDQVALDLRLHLMRETGTLMLEIVELMNALVGTAEKYVQVIMPGYTHLQRAQPVRLAHHLMAYFQMFRRDWERLRDSVERTGEMPLGSAALAGTTFGIDRESVAKELGFPKVSANSMDAVSDRDFALEFLFNCAVVMMHLSRLAEEFILWSSQEFGFCTLPDEFCSGSSIMPQKKNPDACELIRGKTGRVYGNLLALLTVLKALPLAYNKDLQEDKEPVFDSLDTVKDSLRVVARMIPKIEFHSEKMMQAASDPSLAATDLADRLVREEVPFRQAHARIGEIIRRGRGVSGGNAKKGAGIPSPEQMAEARNQPGGTALARVTEQIREAREFLKQSSSRRR